MLDLGRREPLLQTRYVPAVLARGREEIEAEIAAFVGSWLDGAYEMYERGFEIKTFAFIFETEFPAWEEGGFPSSEIGFTCSDTRNWVQAGLFRRAMLIAEREGVYPPELDEESDDDERAARD